MMSALTLPLVALLALAADPLGPGDHARSLKIGEADRAYLLHVPPQYDPKRPTPVVLVLHGAGTNGWVTVSFCGMNKKSDEAGFIGKSTKNLSANDLIWDFFEKHPMP